MTPAGLPLLVEAEVRKLLSRTSVRLLLLLLLVIALGVPAVLAGLASLVEQVPDAGSVDAPAPQVDLRATAATMVGAVRMVRSFFVFRVLLIAVVAVSVAGEFASRTLREDLVRPVSRQKVLAARWIALSLVVVAGAVVPLLASTPLALLLGAPGGEWESVLWSYGRMFLADIGFLTLVVAISIVLRSVPGTLGGVVLYFVLDRALGVALWAIESGAPMVVPMLEQAGISDGQAIVDVVAAVRPWLPSAAFNLEGEVGDDGAVVRETAGALAIYTALAYVVAAWRFQTVDVD